LRTWGGKSGLSADAKGVTLQVIGNAETYNIHLRTGDLDRPWQSFRQTFTAPAEWTLCHFEFGDFEAHRTDEPLRIENIRRIGIVAIGRVFDADAAVSAVSYCQLRQGQAARDFC
jgi:hypothetical protein